MLLIGALLIRAGWGLRQGNEASLFASLFIAINPFLIYFSALILSESLFIAMLAWGMVLSVNPTGAACAVGGLLLSLSILVRPAAIFLPLFLLIIRPRMLLLVA